MRIKFRNLKDILIDDSIDLFCMPETWLYNNKSGIISDLTPKFHVLHHAPSPDKKGDGVGCLISRLLQTIIQHTKSLKSFECMEVQLSNERKKSFLTLSIDHLMVITRHSCRKLKVLSWRVK